MTAQGRALLQREAGQLGLTGTARSWGVSGLGALARLFRSNALRES
jgi:hypothetical protein